MKELEEILINKKILIVDDESFMRTVLAGIIKHMGCNGVTEARDGKSALSLLAKNEFDVCFCDWEMPGLSGIELFKEIKDKEKYKRLKYIMVTGNSEAEKVKEAIELGVHEYIAKPFNENIIRQKLIKVLSQLSVK